MKYMLIFHGSKADFDRRTDPKKGSIFWSEFMAYVHAIQNADPALRRFLAERITELAADCR
jgi:hypothetical protein